MSNQTDLDWLARNVHEWIGRGQEKVFRTDKAHGGAHWIAYPECLGVQFFTKHQWLARRAELQGKPSWDDAPEWAEWLSQNNDGEWSFHSQKPVEQNGFPCFRSVGSEALRVSFGEVLGDWRDTLERRPKSKTRAQAEVELINAAAEVFRPFISIEDNQGQGMTHKAATHQSEKQQDNSWHERGELPPVGEFVDVEGEDLVYGDGESNCEVLAHIEDTAVIRMSYGLGCFQSRVLSPSRTEREEAIEEMTAIMKGATTGLVLFEDGAAKLYDAGYRKESK